MSTKPKKKKTKPKQDAMLQQWLNPGAKKASKKIPKKKAAKTDVFAESQQVVVSDSKDKTVSPEIKEKFISSIDRYTNALADTVPTMKRKQTLRELQDILLNDEFTIDEEMVKAFQRLLKPLLKRFADVVEFCRDLAIKLIIRLMEHLDPAESVRQLPYVVPVLMSRMGMPDPSEEIRGLLMQVLRVIIEKACEEPMFPLHLYNIAVILSLAMQNRDPNITVEACACCTALGQCKQLGEAMRDFGKELVSLTIPHLIHKHARVRIAAIKAVHKMMPHGAGELIRDMAAFREHNLIVFKELYENSVRINYMGKLVTDGNPKVRIAYMDMITDWLMYMHDAGHYETLLMPYILSGFTDDIPEVQALSMKCILKMGQYHMDYHKYNYEDELFYANKADDRSRSYLSASNLKPLLPPPHTERPPLGARKVVQKFIPRLLPALIKELDDWQSTTKEHSEGLLLTLLVYGEEYICLQLTKLIPAFEMCCLRKPVSKKIITSMKLIGRYGILEHMLDAIMSHLTDPHLSNPHRRRGALEFLGWLLTGASPLLMPDQLPAVIGVLSTDDFVCSYDIDYFKSLCWVANTISKLDKNEFLTDQTKVAADCGNAFGEALFILATKLAAWSRSDTIKLDKECTELVQAQLTETLHEASRLICSGKNKKALPNLVTEIHRLVLPQVHASLSKKKVSEWGKVELERLVVCLEGCLASYEAPASLSSSSKTSIYSAGTFGQALLASLDSLREVVASNFVIHVKTRAMEVLQAFLGTCTKCTPAVGRSLQSVGFSVCEAISSALAVAWKDSEPPVNDSTLSSDENRRAKEIYQRTLVALKELGGQTLATFATLVENNLAPPLADKRMSACAKAVSERSEQLESKDGALGKCLDLLEDLRQNPPTATSVDGAGSGDDDTDDDDDDDDDEPPPELETVDNAMGRLGVTAAEPTPDPDPEDEAEDDGAESDQASDFDELD